MYLGQVGYGVVMLFTLGFCGIGQLLDLVLLPDAVKAANRGLLPEDQPTPEAAATSPTSPSYPISSEASRPSVQADDAELDQLLRAAQESVNRTQQQSGE